VYVPLLHGAQIFKMLRNKKSHFSRARQSITGTAGKKPSDPENLAAGSTSAGINSNARSLAIVNAVMANGGALNGVRLLSEEACAASMAKVKIENDAFFGMKTGLSQVREPALACTAYLLPGPFVQAPPSPYSCSVALVHDLTLDAFVACTAYLSQAGFCAFDTFDTCPYNPYAIWKRAVIFFGWVFS